MTAISYSIFNSTSLDPISSSFFLVNHASNGLFALGLVFFIGVVVYALTYFRTADLGKSASISFVMSSFISIILYYWGYEGGYSGFFPGEEFLSTVFLFSIIILTVLILTGVTYFKKGE